MLRYRFEIGKWDRGFEYPRAIGVGIVIERPIHRRGDLDSAGVPVRPAGLPWTVRMMLI